MYDKPSAKKNQARYFTFFNFTKKCKWRLEPKIVLSYAIYRLRHRKPLTIRRCARDTGLDYDTVRRAVSFLVDARCLEAKPDGYWAIEPPEDVGLHIPKSKALKAKWYNRYSGNKGLIGRKLRAHVHAVEIILHQLPNASISQIARLLGIGRAAVRRAQRELAGIGDQPEPVVEIEKSMNMVEKMETGLINLGAPAHIARQLSWNAE